MFLGFIRMPLSPDGWDAALARFRASALPALEHEPGFMRVLVTAEPAAGRAVLLTMWQNAESAERFAASGANRLVEPFRPILAGDPEIEALPVLVDREF